MAETLETKREGGARTRAMPMKRKKERVATCMVLETASLTGYAMKNVEDVSFSIWKLQRRKRSLDNWADHQDKE